jgi:hypothetical protein
MSIQLYTIDEVSDILRMSPETLKKWRAESKGPPWMRLETKAIRYPSDGLAEWLQSQLEGSTDVDNHNI